MVVGESLELFIVFGSILFSILLLVIIDRIGTVRGPLEDEEEEL
jgi:hypothetical protein